jgi:phosphoserine phosphatase RsbU/P
MSVAQPRLLVVDDNEDNRYTLTMMLNIEGYDDVVVAEDGVKALDLLKSEAFDLVLLDVMMPHVNGYEVLAELKNVGRLRDLPVLMISAVTELDSVVRCIELGAVDYLPKPFNPVLLKARIAACLEKKRLRDALLAHAARMESELAVARDLQMSMVPRIFPAPTPQCPIEIHAVMQPAHEVGGDLYDFFRLEDGRLAFLLGDVSDKGVPAALFMARTKNLVRLLTELARGENRSILPPGEIMTRVNRELCTDNATLMFVTMLLGLIDPAGGTLELCNAGHNDPYYLGREGVRAIATRKGIPLGIKLDRCYETTHMPIDEGDTLFVFSDGVTDAINRNQEPFSEARLESVLRALLGTGAQNIISGVADAVLEYAVGQPQADDITMLALRLWPQSSSQMASSIDENRS